MKTKEAKKRVLIVDDDKTIVDLIAELLHDEGMDTYACYDGEEALAALDGTFDIALLDIMMPGGIDGFELCKRIRATSDIPIMFLSAKHEEADKVFGLSIGADDYVTKPFQTSELVARVKAHLRRNDQLAPTGQSNESQHSVLKIHDLELDILRHKCRLCNKTLTLTPKEFSILRLLIEKPGIPHSSQEIFEKVWQEPYDPSAGNTVIVHIRRLRKKIIDIDDSRPYIATVWGVGYKIEE